MVRPTGLILAALVSGCGSDLNAPPTPTLEVVVVTIGQPVDPDGYSLQVDGRRAMPLGVNATIRVSDLIPGSHEVVLDGVALNCQLSGPNPRTVGVSAGDVTTVRFEIQCGTPPGSLEIVIATTGAEPDPDGYLVSVDGAAGVPVGVSGTLSLPQIVAGEHEIRLGGLAPNCSVLGNNPRLVTVERDPVQVDVEVHCSHPAGTIRITTLTGGPRPDVDGYEVAIDGAPRHVDANATLTVPDLPVGDTEIRLDGIASNCRVDGENPRTVSLAIGAVVTVTFTVGCLPSGEGIILFSSDRSGASHVYRVRQDDRELRDLTPGFEAAGGDWSPDGSRIVFTRATATGQELMVMDGDGHNPAPLGIVGARPRWSPDGRTIAFTGTDGMITVIDAGGSGATPLADGFNPDWSPDGTRIAFERVERGQCVFDLFCPSSIYVMNRDGTGQQLVAEATGAADRLQAPDWSPDGSQIAYTRACCAFGIDLSGLYVTGANGGTPRLVWEARPVQSGPIWSPDGTLLLVAAGGGNSGWDLTMIPVDGSSSVTLARAPGHDYPQAWR
jgi:TolB protein